MLNLFSVQSLIAKLSLTLIGLMLNLSPSLSFADERDECRIVKTEWSVQDEADYSAFIEQLGSAVERRLCDTVANCMVNPRANPFRSSDPDNLVFKTDCGRLSPMLRAYFACKKGLPHSMSSAMAPRPVAGNNQKDKRYTRFGNKVVSRKDLTTPKKGKFLQIDTVINEYIMYFYSTMNYRFFHEESDHPELYADFYPVKIQRGSIKPGTVIYDPNGHVVTVFRIENDGRIKYIDSHPDNTLTSGYYSSAFVRSNPYQGAGFKNWRPLTLENAKWDRRAGAYIGGKVKGASNRQIRDYSTEQFFGTHPDRKEWKKGKFLIDGHELGYYDFVKARLSLQGRKVDPLASLSNSMDAICAAVQDRAIAVQAAIDQEVHLQFHPDQLPNNIYGTDGPWEIYSTPSRDARLKVQFVELLNETQKHIEMLSTQPEDIEYSGFNLKQDLLQVYQQKSQSCRIEYINSSGRNMELDLRTVHQRLFKLSFDPYHCPELRWGADLNSNEGQSCSDDREKVEWYQREQRLRNQVERNYEQVHGFRLRDLTDSNPNNGVATPPEIDLESFLSR